jgi:hypothetical protein
MPNKNDPRHRSKKPIHNVKDIPAEPVTGCFILEHVTKALVEPIGIEPMTSSLQS